LGRHPIRFGRIIGDAACVPILRCEKLVQTDYELVDMHDMHRTAGLE
jgi:hypothetical protein